ncbi:MAG: NADH-quinone oxidoreductase subunit NuoK [Actinomycetes bacterium]|jgi:NADH:ubiquinone oxidoreductase subunit K|nr:NADH-quinone oxidoreductase subunit NuoK [Actinomycetes bacterium]
MPSVGLIACLLLAAALFVVGLYGAISHDSAVGILMSLEIMAIAVSINLMAFARFAAPAEQAALWFFAVFLMVITAAELGIGLALVVAIYRRARTSDVDDLHELRG